MKAVRRKGNLGEDISRWLRDRKKRERGEGDEKGFGQDGGEESPDG